MSNADIITLSACSFAGNVGAGLTGFGQAIILFFVWKIVELSGYDGDFKYAVFIQALLLSTAQVWRNKYYDSLFLLFIFYRTNLLTSLFILIT